MTTRITLPVGEDAGTRRSWALPVSDVNAPLGIHELADATFIGVATTRTDKHTNHDATPYAPPKVRCTACRWYEPRLFRVHGERADSQHYVVHHMGGSTVPGEVPFCRVEEVFSAHAAVELFTVRPGLNDTDARGNARTPFLSRPGARVLAMAAGHDAAIDDAYINRNVQ